MTIITDPKITYKQFQYLKDDFSILQQPINDKPLVYLDNAATTQKPKKVIDAVTHFYQFNNANVHRGVYTLSERATAAYEAARQTVRYFIHARHNHEIIFVRGTTEAINLVAYGFTQNQLNSDDEIVISGMEHHSNIVPWQIASQQTGARLRIIPINDDGNLDLIQYKKLLTNKTKIVSITHISNALGTVNPVKKMIAMAHEKNIPVLLDGAQAVSRLSVNVQELDCDFYAFSAHKMYGPTGTGVLYGKTEWLDKLPPYQTGGNMIRQVSFEKTEYDVLPHKFEAGTPNMTGIIGMAAAMDYLTEINFSHITRHECELTEYTMDALQSVSGLQVIGTCPNKMGVISFIMHGVHPHDIGTILDNEGIAVRAGNHCAMPLMKRFGIPATVRVSLGLYNRIEDIDQLVQGLKKVKNVLS